MPATLPDSAQRHRELLDELIEDVVSYSQEADLDLVTEAFAYACAHHDGQRRKSGEEFIYHPWGVAKICARLRQPSTVLAAALLHDVVEDTDATSRRSRASSARTCALLVDGVTKLSRIQFASREEAEAENYRKMILSMAQDIRVIVIKLADRLHNMRTLSYLGKQKQIQKAQGDARGLRAAGAPPRHPLHQVGARGPRVRDALPAQVRRDRGDGQRAPRRSRALRRRGRHASCAATWRRSASSAEISGRAKHFYSIFVKMTRRGKEFNEIYDLTAMRVLVDSDKDCYGAIGVIHALWKPMPGRFKDYVAMPKTNGYQSLHTTVIGPQGKPLEIQVRTQRCTRRPSSASPRTGSTRTAARQRRRMAWLRDVVDSADVADPAGVHGRRCAATCSTTRSTSSRRRARSRRCPPARRRSTSRTPCTPTSATAASAPRSTGASCRCTPRSSSGDIVEVLTSKRERGPSRDWLTLVRTTRARNKIRQWFAHEQREDLEQQGRDSLAQALKVERPAAPEAHLLAAARRGDPRDGLQEGRGLLRRHRRRQGAGRPGRRRRCCSGSRRHEVVEESSAETVARHSPRAPARRSQVRRRRRRHDRRRRARAHGQVLHAGAGRRDHGLHLGRPRHHDPPRGLPQRARADALARALHARSAGTASRRSRSASRSPSTRGIARACWRTSGGRSPSTAATSSSTAAHVQDQMASNWYVIEVGDVRTLKAVLSGLRQVESVFDAYRVTPGAR